MPTRHMNPRPCADCRTVFTPSHAANRYCKPCQGVRQRRYEESGNRRCQRCKTMYPTSTYLFGYSSNGWPKLYRYCEPCRTVMANRPRSTRVGDDLLAMAEQLLYPGVDYFKMTKAQREECIAWAWNEGVRRGIIIEPTAHLRRRPEAA